MKHFYYYVGLAAALLWQGCTPGTQQESGTYSNTVRIEQNDDSLAILAKAAHIVPTANQMDALRNEFIAFVHFGPNTFTRKEWGNGMEDPKIFDLRELDTDQWCEAMRAAGIKLVILTAKHHDGFVLWQSRYTKHGVMSSPFREGKGDILRDLSASCAKYGLKLGIYLSPADLYQIESPDGLYGNLSPYTKRTIPREVPGRPFANPTKFEFVVDDYNEYFLNQLFELLTEYGPIHEVWFDGAHPKRKGGQTYAYQAWKKLIRTLAPEAVIFGREDIRWCGNEAGRTRVTEWNVIPYDADPDTLNHFSDMTKEDLASIGQLQKARYLHYQPAETNTSIREGWFYRDDTHQRVRSADDVFDIYERAVGGNSIFLLNIPPNREGRFSQTDVAVLRETGERIRETYGVNLLADAEGPEVLLDADESTFLTLRKGHRSFVVETARPVTLNRFLIQEAVATRGERVEAFALDAWVGDDWQEIARSTNIGYKRILRFPDVTTNRLRVRILQSRLDPSICQVSAHHYQARPPQLEIVQDKEGWITIAPEQQDFGWKSHGQNAVENLNAGFRIYYTTDGSEPTEKSTEHTEPFLMDGGRIKAVAILNGERGSVADVHIGLPKAPWKVLKQTPKGIVIDLGKEHALMGIAYKPSTASGRALMTKGIVRSSTDGRTWEEVGTFEFGNLLNDPSKRYWYFPRPCTARYLRIQASETLREGSCLTVEDVDVLAALTPVSVAD